MTEKPNAMTPLLAALTPRLEKLGFGASDIEAADSRRDRMYARVQSQSVERLLIGIENSPNKKGEWSFSVGCGLEFHDLDRERFWIGIPGTHFVSWLPNLLRKQTDVEFRSTDLKCRLMTDWEQLAQHLAKCIEVAFRTIQRDAESLRQNFLKHKANTAKLTRQRIEFWSKKLGSTRGGLKDGLSWNVFQLSVQLLKSSDAQCHVLERVEPSAANQREWQRLTDLHQQIVKLVEVPVHVPDQGTGDHPVIPHRGVKSYAFWHTFPLKLYVAVVQDGAKAPVELILGTSNVQLSRPIPNPCKLEFVETSLPAKVHTPAAAAKSAKKSTDKLLDRAKKLLADPDHRFVEIRAWEFDNEADAHDEGIVDEYYDTAAQALDQAIATLTGQYGPATKRARGEYMDIPRCGIVDYALWEVENRRLYAAWLHEDRELPLELILGTLPPKQAKRHVRRPAAAKKPATSTRKITKTPKRKSR